MLANLKSRHSPKTLCNISKDNILSSTRPQKFFLASNYSYCCRCRTPENLSWAVLPAIRKRSPWMDTLPTSRRPQAPPTTHAGAIRGFLTRALWLPHPRSLSVSLNLTKSPPPGARHAGGMRPACRWRGGFALSPRRGLRSNGAPVIPAKAGTFRRMRLWGDTRFRGHDSFRGHDMLSRA